MLARQLGSVSSKAINLPCTCSRGLQRPPSFVSFRASSRRSASTLSIARLRDLPYDLRRWTAKLRRFRRDREWESLVLGLIGANLLVWLAWKPAKALRVANQEWLDDFLRDNILVSWNSLTSGRLWTLLTCSLANHSGLHLFFNIVVLIPALPLALDAAPVRPVLAIYFLAGALSSTITAVWAHYQEQEHGKSALLTTTLEWDDENKRYVERFGPIGAAQAERLTFWGSIPGRSVAYAEGGTAATYGIISFLLAAYSPKYAAGKLIPGYYLGAPFRVAFLASVLVDLFLARKRTDTSMAAAAQLSGIVTGVGAFGVLRRMKMLR